MTVMIDETHQPFRRSWIASANGHAEFPIQNLPLCVFDPGDDEPRCGVAIGGEILDLSEAHRAGVFSGDAALAGSMSGDATLNRLFAAGSAARIALRRQLVAALTEGSPHQRVLEPFVHPQRQCTMHLPASIGDYTDFYAGIHHAMNVGKQFRPDNPLLPNYKYVPIGYHGRSSSICVSGTPVTRPSGQRKGPDDPAPIVGPSKRLDYELELAIWVGRGNALGTPIPIADAPGHIAGYGLLNDWSARDLQGWEYQPLGPFLAKNFATSVSSWVITPEALAPFRIAQPARPAGDPAPLPYLLDDDDQREGAFEIELQVLLLTEQMRARGIAPEVLAISSTRHLYWTVAQLLTHHASNGCNLRPGDLLGTGTISSPTADGCGSLLETSDGGKKEIALASGERRTFLQDGDEVILRAHARRDGYASIGFGEVTGRIVSRC